MPFPSRFKPTLTALILVSLLSTQMLGNVDLSKSAAVKPHLGVVAILVDDAVYSNPTSYDGLHPEYGNPVPKTTLKGRIDRYAEAIQSSLPMTKSLIVRVKSGEAPDNIMHALEKLYFEGDGDRDAITKLTGVVLVGNVPIPVVTKKNNRYLSLLPYTDFEDKVYLFNPGTGDFERSPEVTSPGPEVWHGVIMPPTGGEEGNQLLAEYFDKNHLFRNGYSDFNQFDEKLFYADTIAEKKVLNKTGIDAYERFVNNWEDISYNRYTTKLAKSLYEEVNGALDPSDGMDNDNDGLQNEDPINGQDDDADGLIDEDDGDPNYGIDNDGDCWAQPSYLWDTNGDGRPCYIDDNFVDEDGTNDNNNDGDNLTDEDNPGDANGDGCPGQCGKDEDGDSEDWDGDHFPNGFEIEILGSNPTKKKNPTWIRWSAIPAPEKAIIQNMYVDEAYPTYDPNCFVPAPGGPPVQPIINPFIPPGLLPPISLPPVTPSSYFNGSLQWNPDGYTRPTLVNNVIQPGIRCGSMSETGSTVDDDDEDGFIDEDTSTDNDADGDGVIDEDRRGTPISNLGTGMFDNVPDIDSKKIIQSFLKKYPELFKRFIGTLNEWVDFTGRYRSAYRDPNGNLVSDRASLVGLIGERDEYVQMQLKAVNDLLEAAVDSFISTHNLAKEIPLVGGVVLDGTVNFLGEDSNGDLTVPLPTPIAPARTFINFNLGFVPDATHPFPTTIDDWRLYMYGTPAHEITNVGACSLYRGSYDEGGNNQLVEANRVYDYSTAGSWGDQTDQPGGESYAGCYGNFSENRDYCFPDFSQYPVRSQVGTELVRDPDISVDYRSCYNLRDMASFFGEANAPGTGYFFYAMGPAGLLNFYNGMLEHMEDTDGIDPNDNYSWPSVIPLYTEKYDQDLDGDFDEDDIILHVANYKAELAANGIDGEPYKHPDEIELVDTSVLPAGYYLTLGAVLTRLGINKNNHQEVGDFLINTPAATTVTFPSLPLVESVNLQFTRLYATEPPVLGAGVPYPSDAAALADPLVIRVPSLLKHIEPIDSTINQQLAMGFSKALPVDDPRYVTFQDQNLNFTRIDYPNVYDVTTWQELYNQLDSLEDTILGNVAGTDPSMKGFLTNLLGSQIFETQVADALRWRAMNIDEKHKWVFTSYLDPKVHTFVGKPKNGFESLYLVADGEADRVNMSFYANTVEKDQDYEFNHLEPAPEGGAEPEAGAAPVADPPGSYDPGDPNSQHISWFPFVWIYDMVEWVGDLTTTVAKNAAAVIEEGPGGIELACGGSPDLGGRVTDTDHDGIPDNVDSKPHSSDEDGDGLPDGAEPTSRLSLDWEENRVLYANGSDRALLRVRALDSNGAVNAYDGASTVQLRVTRGNEFVQLINLNESSLVNGVVLIPIVTTKTGGAFTVEAVGVSDNLAGVTSNTLTLESKRRHLKLSTYEKEFVTQDAVIRTETLEDVLILDDNNVAVGVVEAGTGQLRLFDKINYRIDVKEGTSTEPTRLEVVADTGGSALATYTIRPQVEQVVIETSPGKLRGQVNDVRVVDRNSGDEWGARAINGDVLLTRGDQPIGMVKPDGRVYLKDGPVISLGLGTPYPAIDNPHLHLTVDLGETVLFDVVMGTSSSLLSIQTTGAPTTVSTDAPAASRNTTDPVGFFEKWAKKIPLALAALQLPDTDKDGLDDLSEWTIGTDLNSADTDGDSYSDRVELDNGFDPLKPGMPLFTDLSPAHQAYKDVIELYTRGIIRGYEDRTFRPDNAITREEFTKLNLGAVCVDCSNFATPVRQEVDRLYSTHPFPDTNLDPNLLACVAHSRNEGLIDGYKGGEFSGYYLPRNTMSRAEATKVLIETADIGSPPTPDVSAPWYMNYVISAQKRGLYPKGRFSELDSLSGNSFGLWFAKELVQQGPIRAWLEGPITRGEFAMMVGAMTRVQDCRLKDTDKDGLPDTAETFSFGTDPFNPDTDYGGVNDYIEVVRGQNAVNDPTDDYPGGDIVPSPPTVPSSPVVVAPPVADTDSDGDGLFDADEALYGTDPFDPDTDDGGITDFEEVLAGTNPLDPIDESDALTAPPGARVAGLHLSRDSVYTVDNDKVLFESKRFTKLIPADGSSQLFVKAELIDENGIPDSSDDSTIVEFLAVDPSNPYAEILRKQVRMTKGVAETEILASTVSGYFELSATSQASPSGDVPVLDTTVHVYPGQPASIRLASDSAFLKSGGLNKTTVGLTLEDRFKNVANMDPYQITLSVDGPAVIDLKDEDPEQAGLQTMVYEGNKTFDLISGDNEGTATILARFGEVKGTLAVGVYDDIALELHPTTNSLTANGATQTTVEVWAVLNHSGAPLNGFNGVVTFGVTDPLYGSLGGPPQLRMDNGKASIDFTAGTVAGLAYMTATMIGFDPATLPLTLLPGPAVSLELSSTSDVVVIEDVNPSSVEVQVKAYDMYDNFVNTDFSTPVALRVTSHSARFGSIDLPTGVLSAGMAVFHINARDLTGPIDLVASSPGLRSAAHTINSILEIRGEEFSGMQPDVLFGALLGSGFGDVTKSNYVGGWFTFSGTTQSALSLVSDPTPHRRLASFDSNGKVAVLDGSAVDTDMIPANSKTLPGRFFIKDLVTKQTVAEGLVIPSSSDFYILNATDDLKTVTDNGMYVQPILEHERYELRESKGNVSLLENKDEIVRLQSNGQVQIYDPNYSLAVNEDYPGFAFDVMLGEAPVIRVFWKQTFEQDVIRLDDHFAWEDWTSLTPGVYFMGVDSSVYGYETAYSGNSSLNPTGNFVVDKTEGLPTNQRPGLGKNSLESAQTTPGIGFDGDNKFMLALTDGMMVGEAHQAYASDIGIVLGDPTVRLTDANPQEISATGYTKGIGRLLLSGNETIQDVSSLDYNSDGLKDVMVAFENGVVQLLENRDSTPRFVNRGPILNFSNGIVDMTENDFNKDGQTDIVVATAESCIQGEVCVYLYTNHDANFIRKNLELKIKGDTIKQITSEDLNKDGYPDLIVSDLSGSILVFYNKKGEILKDGDLLGNLGVELDATKNLAEEVMVRYRGMPTEDSNDPQDDGWFKEFPVPADGGLDNAIEKFSAPVEGLPTGGFDPSSLGALVSDAQQGGSNDGLIYDVETPKINNNVPFIYADADPNFVTSTKFGQDVNAGIVEDGDVLEYTVRLANGGSSVADKVAFTDVVSTMLSLDWASITCHNSPGASCGQMKVIQTGLSARPFVVSGLVIQPGSYVEVSYRARARGAGIPTVKLFTGNDLSPDYPDDDTIDIAATPEGNASGQIVYFYSNGTYRDKGIRKINYAKLTSTPEPPPTTNFFDTLGIDLNEDSDGDGTPNALQGDSSSGPPAIATDLYEGQVKQDDDGDGLNNLWDDMNGKVTPQDVMADVDNGLSMVGNVTTMVADTMETLMSQMLCSGGCIASPINVAFLVPGPINLFGIPVFPMDMAHIPVFGAPASGGPVPLWPPLPWQGTTAVRIYVSITTTLGFTMSVCVGSYLSGQCWSFAIPLFEALGVCDAVNGAMSDAMSTASSAISSGVNKLMSLPGQIPGAGTGGGRSESGGLVNYDLGSYAVAADSGSGSRVPGFPKPFAEWLRKQAEEVVNKLTDLPDIYFYYPDPQSIIGAFKPQNVDKIDNADLRGLEKILTVLNSFPILRVETEAVQFKIPTITNDEIEKMKTDYTQWLDDMKDQWAVKKPSYDKPEYAEAMAEIEQLLNNVEKNLETLEEYKTFPKKLLKWRNAESYYIKQIICYLDAIINNLVGWVVINKGRVEQWIKAFSETKESLKSWQNIFQLALDYQNSCDQCTNDRMSLFELLAKLFMFIPEPPIIEIPRWPDIVIDLSQIQAGLTVVWPEIQFEQQPILLPRLPRITIPDVPSLPTISSVPGQSVDGQRPGTSYLNLPTIPLLPQLPNLPDLPQLPGIPIPELPDLPPPPKIPALPQPVQVTLKVVSGLIKILCLLQSGIIPTSESSLKTTIEDMTQRPLDPVMPFDLSVNFQAPAIPIDFYDQIEIIAYVNLGLNFDGIVRAVELAAEASSDLVTDLVGLANQGLSTVGSAANEAVNAPGSLLDGAVDGGTSAVDRAIDTGTGAVDGAVTEVTDELSSLTSDRMKDIALTQEARTMLANPYVQPYIAEWTRSVKDMETFAKEQAVLNAQVPAVHHLTATQGMIALAPDEIEKRFDAIQESYLAGSLQNLNESPLTGLRGHLLASFETHQDDTRALASLVDSSTDASWDDLTRWIASTGDQGSTLPNRTMLASTNDAGNTVLGTDTVFDRLRSHIVATYSTTPSTSPLASEIEDVEVIKERYLATSGAGPSGTGSAPIPQPVLVNKGIFIYNPLVGVNERLIEYTGEADDDSSHLIFMDMENDRDEDIIYGYGSNLYLKENFNQTKPLDYVTDNPQIVTLERLIPPAPALDLYRTKASNNRSAAAAWRPAAGSVLGYELRMVDSLADIERERPRLTHGATFLAEAAPVTPVLEKASGDAVAGLQPSALPPGGVVESAGDSVKLDYSFPEGDATVRVDKNTTFFIPDLELARTQLVGLSGAAYLPAGSREHTLVKSSGSVDVQPGDLIHAAKNSSLVLSLDGGSDIKLDLPINAQFTVASGYTGKIRLRVNSGWVEVIGDSLSDEPQSAFKGMVLLESDRLIYENQLTIGHVTQVGAIETTLRGPGEFEWHALTNGAAPALDLVMQNGDYYSQLRTILPDGQRGTWGETQLFSPQICGDKSLPYPNIGMANQRLSVFKTVTLDGSGSFDSDSPITRYYWDTDLETDSNGDGDPTNDASAHHDNDPLVDSDGDGIRANDWDDPTLTVGPWDTPGVRSFKLWVTDEAGNTAGTVVKVDVFVPDIALQPSSGRSGVIEGAISTTDAGIPFVIARERDGVFELLSTPSAGDNNKYTTQDGGTFVIDDLDLKEEWAIFNARGEEVAVVDKATGQLKLTGEGYTVEVRSAELPWPTRVILKDPSGAELLYIFMVPDSNVDVRIDSTLNYTTETVASMTGVHVKPVDLPAQLRLEKIPSNDPLFTGGAILIDSDETRWAVIDTDGNIYLLKDMDLGVKDSAAVNAAADQIGAEPIVLTLGADQVTWLEIFISPRARAGAMGEARILSVEALGLARTTAPILNLDPTRTSTDDQDGDGVPDLDELRAGLNPFDGTDGSGDLDGDHLTNAEEFRLGTNPNRADTDGDGVNDFQELKQGTDPLKNDASYFKDILATDPLYQKLYQFVQLNIVDGFPQSDGIYFKPTQLITRAEYTKVLLSMLCIAPRPEAYLSPSVFYDIPYQKENLPWYYPITKESNLQGFIQGYLREINEAGQTPFKPNQSITRAEGTKIILEALETLGAVDLGSVSAGIPWYAPYMVVAQDLNPYMVDRTGGEGKTYIVTPQEAADPNALLSRYDFMVMAGRVLSAVNCFATQDTDGDGLSDFDEVTVHGTNPHDPDTDHGGFKDGKEVKDGSNPLDRRDDDTDGDGLVDLDEVNIYGTNPYDPDTDDGGVYDGEEVLNGTEPIRTPSDDRPLTLPDESTVDESIDDLQEISVLKDVDPGLTIVTYACTSCPCDLSIENKADIASGDTLFAAIMDAANKIILSVSNKVAVTDLFKTP